MSGIPEPLSEENRIKFLRGFNAEPPVSDYNPEKIFLIMNRGVLVAFFVDGPCVTLINPVPAQSVRTWMSSLST